MGMMDGGDNFKDRCHACDGTAMGGTMLRSIDDRNKKICSIMVDTRMCDTRIGHQIRHS